MSRYTYYVGDCGTQGWGVYQTHPQTKMLPDHHIADVVDFEQANRLADLLNEYERLGMNAREAVQHYAALAEVTS